MTPKAFRRISVGIAAGTLCFGLSTTLHAQKFVKGERPQQRGYSLAVITEGGKTVCGWAGRSRPRMTRASHSPATSKGRCGRYSSC